METFFDANFQLTNHSVCVKKKTHMKCAASLPEQSFSSLSVKHTTLDEEALCIHYDEYYASTFEEAMKIVANETSVTVSPDSLQPVVSLLVVRKVFEHVESSSLKVVVDLVKYPNGDHSMIFALSAD